MTEKAERRASIVLLIFSLLFGLAAAGAVLFVIAEPIAAYERLAAGDYSSFSEAETQRSMARRMNQASLPLIAGSVLAILGLALGLKGRGSRLFSKAPVTISTLVLLAALYVWLSYGGEIIGAL